MFRVQVWDERAKAYVDAHVLYDQCGATGFEVATATLAPSEFETGLEAVRTADDLGSVAELVCVAIDVDTGRRYFDVNDLPEEPQQ